MRITVCIALSGLTVWGALALEPVVGRYVRVEIPKEKATLSLAEVQVFSKGENVALKGVATQSGTEHRAEASRAIDGNTDGYFEQGSVTHTLSGIANPWWEVDLGVCRPIERIVVWNRSGYGDHDAPLNARLAGARVLILDADRKEVWGRSVPEPVRKNEWGVTAEGAGKTAAPPAAGALPDELKRLGDVYEKNLADLVAEQKAQARTLADRYLAALKALQERAQKAGNLDGVLAATEERERVIRGEVAAEGGKDTALAELKTMRTAYLAARRAADADSARKISDLTQKYAKALEWRQAELTRKGLIDEAVAFKAARTALDAQPEVVWATTALTNMAAVAALPAAAPSAPKTLKRADQDLYLVVDLARGVKANKYPVKRLAAAPKGGWDDEYKTDKLVLRRIEPGTFTMGSPSGELGRRDNEVQHQVTLTRPYYIGLFEVTQKQWELVMGTRPGWFEKARETRPVERVRYTDIRGGASGTNWPANAEVDSSSFVGRLRLKTGLDGFDLPTEAQWEYACRAGTVTALNSGKNLTDAKKCPNVLDVARCGSNAKTGDAYVSPDKGGTATVGTLPANAWGLYEMHGNVLEWCLDWYGPYSGDARDPAGAPSGDRRVTRGGSWWVYDSGAAADCRSASRSGRGPEYGGPKVHHGIGFRVAMTEQ